MQKLILAIGIATLFTAASAFAEESPKRLPQAGESLTSRGHVALRTAGPDADFGMAGETIAWIAENETLRVLSLKQVSTVFGMEVWVEVKAANGRQGWIYDGLTGEVLGGRAKLAQSVVVARAD